MKYIKTYENVNDRFVDLIRMGSYYRVLDMIQNHDIDFNYVEQGDGWTPLTAAIFHENENIVKLLIKNGADVNLPYQNTDEKTTPLMLAGDINVYNIIAMLIEADADWNLKDIYGEDFLDHTYEDWVEIIKEDYPEKYEEYLMKKQAEQYNL
jgi:ankyrin repeat protein